MSTFPATIPDPIGTTYDGTEDDFPILGTLFKDNEQIYKFVKLVSVDGAANKMTYLTTTANEVTIDEDATDIATTIHATGMCTGTVDISDKPYAWVQVTGTATFHAGSAGISKGVYLMPDSDNTDNGNLTAATAGTDANICAIAMATVADDATGLCHLKNILY